MSFLGKIKRLISSKNCNSGARCNSVDIAKERESCACDKKLRNGCEISQKSDFDSTSKRADYAPSLDIQNTKAKIQSIKNNSPAYLAELEPGYIVISANGVVLRDIIDWFWVSDGFEVDIEYMDTKGATHNTTLVREPMEEWGLKFSDNIFDGVRTCKNACTFCFMSMLPSGMRKGMYLRDDDYRLSFLQGNFVTLTNMSDEDINRVIEMDLSPLHMSVHALDTNARQTLMGKNHIRGLEAMHKLLDAGIDLHMQVVLVPGINDGRVLSELAKWAIEQKHVLSLGVVPLGYTKYQDKFNSSYNNPKDALEIIELVRPLQEMSQKRYGRTKLHLADEFYINAYGADVISNLPDASYYDGYPQFFDGIGMLRSLVDEWQECLDEVNQNGGANCQNLTGSLPNILMICGKALAPVLQSLVSVLPQNINCNIEVLGIPNTFFGGNVDVSGLLCGSDVVWTLKDKPLPNYEVWLPEAMFNSDGLTLDNLSATNISQNILHPVRVICYCAKDIFDALHLL